MTYTPPLTDLSFAFSHMARAERLEASGAFESYDRELVEPILEEAGKLARDILAPLNSVGDKSGATLGEDGVKAAPGFAEAYKAFADGGWMGLSAPTEWGGQGLPRSLALCVMEMVNSANMAFGLCPTLTLGAIEALLAHGSDRLQAAYLPNLVSGKWTGTMNLTEPQSGSDLGTLKTKAEPVGDGSYAISGQKIYITWGDHDVAENIVHMVLARLPDAPAGSRGISLFIVPKFLLGDDGEAGERNGVKCIGLEEKIGIHASPTCVMEYDGARGWLVGEENRGLACMFTMMNSARLNVGLQGVAVAEAAWQNALSYARERKQGAAPGVEGSAPIIHHPDVRRMILDMRASAAAARAICLSCGVAADLAETAGTETERQAARQREELLTPIAKAWSTDIGAEAASLGVQVHGGMGYMNETLAAQLYRDARIAPIYEGTNGIQAIDLVGRKLAMGEGAAMAAMRADIDETSQQARESNDPELVAMSERLSAANVALGEATDWMIDAMKTAREAGLAGATAYQALAGDVIGGHFLVRGALAARGQAKQLNATMMALAGFYAETRLAAAPGRVAGITKGGEAMLRESAALFDLG